MYEAYKVRMPKETPGAWVEQQKMMFLKNETSPKKKQQDSIAQRKISWKLQIHSWDEKTFPLFLFHILYSSGILSQGWISKLFAEVSLGWECIAVIPCYSSFPATLNHFLNWGIKLLNEIFEDQSSLPIYETFLSNWNFKRDRSLSTSSTEGNWPKFSEPTAMVNQPRKIGLTFFLNCFSSDFIFDFDFSLHEKNSLKGIAQEVLKGQTD